MQLTEAEYHTAKHNLAVIRHSKDDLLPKSNFAKILNILEFVVEGILLIMFTKDGKPKSKFQLILSIPAMIRFAKKVIELVNDRKDAKEEREPKVRIAGDRKVSQDQINKAHKLANRDIADGIKDAL